jgi:hypothetical protein
MLGAFNVCANKYLIKIFNIELIFNLIKFYWFKPIKILVT